MHFPMRRRGYRYIWNAKPATCPVAPGLMPSLQQHSPNRHGNSRADLQFSMNSQVIKQRHRPSHDAKILPIRAFTMLQAVFTVITLSEFRERMNGTSRTPGTVHWERISQNNRNTNST
jgi:hypothetical protein